MCSSKLDSSSSPFTEVMTTSLSITYQNTKILQPLLLDTQYDTAIIFLQRKDVISPQPPSPHSYRQQREGGTLAWKKY